VSDRSLEPSRIRSYNHIIANEYTVTKSGVRLLSVFNSTRRVGLFTSVVVLIVIVAILFGSCFINSIYRLRRHHHSHRHRCCCCMLFLTSRTLHRFRLHIRYCLRSSPSQARSSLNVLHYRRRHQPFIIIFIRRHHRSCRTFLFLSRQKAACFLSPSPASRRRTYTDRRVAHCRSSSSLA